MVNVSVRTSRRAGVTFAHVLVENPSGERQRVRVAIACDGAVWPPRRRGVPEAGWDADGVTLTVDAGGVRGVGFGTPTSTVDVECVETTSRGGVRERRRTTGSGSESESEGSACVDDSPSVDGVVRALGSFAPPLAATPREGSERSTAASTEREMGWGSDASTEREMGWGSDASTEREQEGRDA
jgi:hypothetical protein